MKTSKARKVHLLAGVAGITVIAACGGGSTKQTAGQSPRLPTAGQQMKLDPANFSANIDNKYMPWVSGTQWTYRGTDDGVVSTITTTATSETKKIANGITARVVRDTATVNGQVTEDTFDWFAQDKNGAVWYFGEDTATFKNGKKDSTEGSFEAGVNGAMAGVAMPGYPQPGPVYRQEYYKGHAEDNGQVLALGQMVDVKFGHFTSVLLTADTSNVEPNGLEYKLYAPGVGNVLSFDIAGGSAREELLSVKKVPAGTATGPLGHP